MAIHSLVASLRGLTAAAVSVAAILAANSAGVASAEPVQPGQRRLLAEGWLLRSSVLVPDDGGRISTTDYQPRQWLKTRVPSTVLSALVRSGVYPDPRVGLNAYRIPDSSDEFNREHDLAGFSYLPDKRNPWRDPYWYRTEFDLPPLSADQRVWLHFDVINYRAEVWVNGKRIADPRQMAGMFQRFQFDITAQAKAGTNVVAVKIYPVDHPGKPDTQLDVLGRCRGEHKEIERDVTEIETTGYDCMMTVPDRNMGICQDVWLEFTGPVDIRNPFVVTDLPLPETDRATLAVSAEVVNGTAAPVRGVLRGTVATTDVRFEQRVELAAHETRLVTIDPKPVIRNPRLWWPVNYGEQHLYELTLQFEVEDGGGQTSKPPATSGSPGAPAAARDGHAPKVSDFERVTFGVRKVTCEMHEIDGWHGRRVLVNGRKIFCRGGYIQPELMFDWDARRMEAEIGYYARANLNFIYFEDIPNPPTALLELCDRYGVLFGNCFYACSWNYRGDDFDLLERCTVDLIKRYRNHPSLIMYMTMNEGVPCERIYTMWRRQVLTLDGTRWFIPSGYFPSDRKDVPAWLKKDLPAGMNDLGSKSYTWQEPDTYFRWVRQRRNWMFMMESGSASLPPISSLSRFLPEVNAPDAAHGKRYPLDPDWAHHGANSYFAGYDNALRRLHGEPESVTDYCWKGHLLTADQHRAKYEAVNHRLWDVTSGFTQWKINACEPSVQWQIFDWYLKPMVSWFYIKNACEPLHVQLNPPDRMVSVINTRLTAQPDLEVRARVFDLNAKLLWEKATKLSVPANTYRESFTIPEPSTTTPVHFVKLELKDSQGRPQSQNFYWLRTRGTSDYKALQSLPPVELSATCTIETRDLQRMGRVTLRNPSGRIALFIQLAMTKGHGGEEILPVVWDDNYFSLLPGESREIGCTFAAQDAKGDEPSLEVGGWNVRSDFDCASLTVSPKEVKVGEPIIVTATVANTFLDGGRIVLAVDGKPVASKWAWARGGRKQDLVFPLRLERAGNHEISVGKRTVTLTAAP